jgi:hypothetical protein
MTKEAMENIMNQAGPCGIVCSSCPLGNGTIAETARRTVDFIRDYKILEWAPFVPEGAEVDWAQVARGLDWMTKYTLCAGCEMGGGPPDCTIRICARERGYELCSLCDELETCARFDWLGDHGTRLKETLKRSRGKSKEEYIEAAGDRTPWEV